MGLEAKLTNGGVHKINDDVIVHIRIRCCSRTLFPKVGVLAMTVEL